LTIKETKELIQNKGDLIILDVRKKEEYEAEHIEGAINIAIDELNRRIDEIEDYKDNPVLVYCRAGNRSLRALILLQYNDFNDLYHMYEGYMKYK
jgi:rhodanese-related sulfurtransferase